VVDVDDARRAARDERERRRRPSVESGSLHRRVPYIAGKWHVSYEQTVVHAASAVFFGLDRAYQLIIICLWCAYLASCEFVLLAGEHQMLSC
jgi:hypothetical protein